MGASNEVAPNSVVVGRIKEATELEQQDRLHARHLARTQQIVDQQLSQVASSLALSFSIRILEDLDGRLGSSCHESTRRARGDLGRFVAADQGLDVG